MNPFDDEIPLSLYSDFDDYSRFFKNPQLYAKSRRIKGNLIALVLFFVLVSVYFGFILLWFYFHFPPSLTFFKKKLK